MLDVDFLSAPIPFSGLLLYRYRSGILRPRLKKALSDLARTSDGTLIVCDPPELSSLWGSSGLIDGIRVCDLSDLQSTSKANLHAIAAMFEEPPAVPTAIFVRESAQRFDGLSKSDTVFLNEPVVTTSNIARVLAFLETSSDLTSSGKLMKQKAFQQYFHDWVAERRTVDLPNLIQHYDRSVLLFASPKTDEFIPSADEDETDPAAPSHVVRSLRQFLTLGRSQDAADLLRTLSRKQERGWSDWDLASELCRATQKIFAGKRQHHTVSVGTAYIGPTRVHAPEINLHALTLWTAMLIAWICRLDRRGSASSDTRLSDFLVRTDQFCRDYRSRLNTISGDPLAGYWSSLNEAFSGLGRIDIEAQDPRKELLLALVQQNQRSGALPLLDKLRRLVGSQQVNVETPSAAAFVPLKADSGPGSIAQLVGHDRASQELRSRFATGEHDRPLMLVGPEGGKKTMAQVYAKTLLCEGELNQDLSPCGRCSSCATFSNGSFGYIELDAGHADAPSHARYHVQKLRSFSFSKHRIVVIKRSDAAAVPIDALLKTFEKGAVDTTFILLACSARGVPAAAMSRSIVCKLRALADAEARQLIARWLPSGIVQERQIDLMVMQGRNLPGPMWSVCDKVLQSSAFSLDGAKALFNLDWGEDALRYWQALLGEHDPPSTTLALKWSISPSEAVRRVRSVLGYLHGRQMRPEPALLGLESRARDIASLMDARARQTGTSSEMLWKSLADHWMCDAIVDAQSYLEAGIQARTIIRGQTVVNVAVSSAV